MATRRYGLSRAETFDQVAEAIGAAVAADAVEVTVELAASLSKEDVLLALEKIKNYIAQNNWPPA